MKKAAITLVVLFCAAMTITSCHKKEHCDAYKNSRAVISKHQR